MQNYSTTSSLQLAVLDYQVIREVPKDRLLVHQAKEGYGPICEFLGLPVPDEPYPRVNDTAAMQNMQRGMKNTAYALVFGLPAALGVAAYLALQYLA